MTVKDSTEETSGPRAKHDSHLIRTSGTNRPIDRRILYIGIPYARSNAPMHPVAKRTSYLGIILAFPEREEAALNFDEK